MESVATEVKVKPSKEECYQSGYMGEVHIKTEPLETTYECVEAAAEVKEEALDTTNLQDPQFVSIKREPSEDGDSEEMFPEEADPLLPDPFADDEKRLFSISSEVPARVCDMFIPSSAREVKSIAEVLSTSTESSTTSRVVDTTAETAASMKSVPTTSAESSSRNTVTGISLLAIHQSRKRKWEESTLSNLEAKLQRSEKIFELKRKILDAELELEKLKVERQKIHLENYQRMLKLKLKYRERK